MELCDKCTVHGAVLNTRVSCSHSIQPLCCHMLCFIVQDCAASTFRRYWVLRQQAVPIGPIPALDAACSTTLPSLLGSLAAQYHAAQLTKHPELLAVGVQQAASASGSRSHPGAHPEHYGYHPTAPPDPTPVLAWSLQGGADMSRVALVLQASYDALVWVKEHAARFPVLAAGTGSHGSNSASSRAPAGV